MPDKHCNIDSRGKAVRLTSGLLLVILAGAFAILITIGSAYSWLWVVAVGLFILGVFAIYEGWSGWCALRAMGINTWI
ncbi:MAG: hypothetical protein ACSHX5_11690 [Phycisphaerales bacterium]